MATRTTISDIILINNLSDMITWQLSSKRRNRVTELESDTLGKCHTYNEHVTINGTVIELIYSEGWDRKEIIIERVARELESAIDAGIMPCAITTDNASDVAEIIYANRALIRYYGINANEDEECRDKAAALTAHNAKLIAYLLEVVAGGIESLKAGA